MNLRVPEVSSDIIRKRTYLKCDDLFPVDRLEDVVRGTLAFVAMATHMNKT